MPLKLSAKLPTNFRVPGFPSARVMSVPGIFSQTIKSSTAKANWDKCVQLYRHSGQHSSGASFKCKQNCWGTQSHHFSGRGSNLFCYWDLTILSLKFSILLSLSTFCLSVESQNYVTFVYNETNELKRRLEEESNIVKQNGHISFSFFFFGGGWRKRNGYA